ncbi:MAG: hypothetical protein L0Y72_02415 [Gemmataceae bacterium]|nr:hypothetical protein [Gemmataceae bacterium]MCI0737870.1 hypothetical protein [Gemmataceae bacterium]
MQTEITDLTCVVELSPGQQLTLPLEFVSKVGPGRWLVSVRPEPAVQLVRRHDAFLSSYTAEDEGLYDDLGG